jgi:hypothetical protein
MNPHPYVRAYMAGIVVPTVFLLVALSAFIVIRLILQFPAPIERAIVFPMAIVPNLWGLWNMLYVRLRQNRHWKIAVHGAILPLVLAPLGVMLGTALGVFKATSSGLIYFGAIQLGYIHVAAGLCMGFALYYLAWKYFVNFFNELLGIA